MSNDPSAERAADAPTVAETRAALSRILASRGFRKAPRLSDFLRYVVEARLGGHTARLKGYTVGVEALGRPDSFDPQADPIVRVEANRLRFALARYYADEGRDDPTVIDLPRGGYLPAISRAPRRAGRAMWRRLRALPRLLAARVRRLLPPGRTHAWRRDDGRQDRQGEQTEGAAAARAHRPRCD